jgi:hypothetical protein
MEAQSIRTSFSASETICASKAAVYTGREDLWIAIFHRLHAALWLHSPDAAIVFPVRHRLTETDAYEAADAGSGDDRWT